MIDTGDKIYAVVWSAIIISALLSRGRGQFKRGAKMALGWLVIIAVVFGGVVYWPELKNSKFYNSLVAGSAAVNEDGSMEFSRADDGHFHINALVNGVSVEFMVDTGAADIVLTREDAKRVGFYESELVFNKIFTTANGRTRAASVKLKNLEIGKYQSGEIYASVNEGELDVSLLGMSFLDRMRSFRVEGDWLILTP